MIIPSPSKTGYRDHIIIPSPRSK